MCSILLKSHSEGLLSRSPAPPHLLPLSLPSPAGEPCFSAPSCLRSTTLPTPGWPRRTRALEAAHTHTKMGRQCGFLELQEKGKEGAPPNYGNPLELTVSGPNSGGSFPRAAASLPVSPLLLLCLALVCLQEKGMCMQNGIWREVCKCQVWCGTSWLGWERDAGRLGFRVRMKIEQY